MFQEAISYAILFNHLASKSLKFVSTHIEMRISTSYDLAFKFFMYQTWHLFLYDKLKLYIKV